MDEPPLTAERLQRALTTRWVGRVYDYVEATGSTNDDLRGRAAADPALPAGAVLLAEYQSAGRGRLGRRWEAPPGSSLLFSVLLRPGWPAEQAAWLTMIAGLAAVAAIRGAIGPSPRVGLKWPNDVMIIVDDEPRKVGGILLDTALDGVGRIESVVVGIGLNVNTPAEALPAAATPPTSLPAATGRTYDRAALLAALLAALETGYEAAAAGRSPRADWDAELLTLGREVVVSYGDGREIVSGRAESTTDNGLLIVRDAAGALHTISAGDVSLRKER